mgnify:CR=1 FL=1
MKLKLRVFDPKINKPSINNDGRWNVEIDIEIPERMILQLVEELTDNLAETQFYLIDAMNRVRKQPITYGEIEEVVRPTRTWRKIRVMLSDMGYESSRFTRISLFEELINIKKMKQAIKDKVHELDQAKSGSFESVKYRPPIQPQLEPVQKVSPKISETNLSEFVKEIK